MSGSLIDPASGDTTPDAYATVSGTGGPEDSKHVIEVVLIDPNTGLRMVPGSVSYSTLTLSDGSDVTEGAKADAVVQGDVAGSVSAKLRGLNKVLGTIADAAWSSGSGSVVALLKAVAGLLAHGQAAMAASVPVAIASDQSAVAVTASAGTNLNTSLLALEGGHLATLATNLPAKGQALMAASTPVALASDQSAVPVQPSFPTVAHIASNAGTLVKSGAGVLHAVVVNKKGATGNTVTVYDGTDNTGTVLAVIDSTDRTGAFVYDLKVTTGVYVVPATGTAPDLTVVAN